MEPNLNFLVLQEFKPSHLIAIYIKNMSHRLCLKYTWFEYENLILILNTFIINIWKFIFHSHNVQKLRAKIIEILLQIAIKTNQFS